MEVELIFYCNSELLESPFWDSINDIIYFVSITESIIYSLNIKTKAIKSYSTNGHVGCVVLDKNGMLISAEKEGIFKINPSTSERLFIGQFEENPEMRYNDGSLDPKGRFLIGTKGYNKEFKNKGKVYLYDFEKYRTIINNTCISNGMGFSKDGDKLYFIDTPTKKVGMYFYDLIRGEAIFDKYIIEIEGEGYPDGMCVDIDEMIWVAEWGGGKVCKWNPINGKKILEIKLPCLNITSCCLGGIKLEYLFITTAKSDLENEKLGGGLYKVKIR